MKLYHIIYPIAAATLLLTSCDKSKMDWETPEGHYPVSSAEIPLNIAEQIANYAPIKTYAAQYTPNLLVGVGFSADMYIKGDFYKELVDANFQMVTPGNAMKMDAIVTDAGSLNFNTVDAMLDAMPEDMRLWGHNFIWHNQQRQAYLRSLIMPDVDTYSDDHIATLLTNGDFETGATSPWSGWGNSSTRTVEEGKGYDGSYGLVVNVPNDGANHYDVQLIQDLAKPLEKGKTYTLRFKARCEPNTGSGLVHVAAQQPSDDYPEEGGNDLKLSSEWKVYERDFNIKKYETLTRLCINTGLVSGKYYFDDIEFGEKKADENPDQGRTNLLANGSFDTNIDGWGKYNGADGCNTWNADEGKFGKGSLQIVNELTEPSNQWKTQIHASLTTPIDEGATFYISYYIKCAEGQGSVRLSTTGHNHYQGDQTVTAGWQRIEWSGTAGGKIDGICIDIAAVPNTYYLDDIVVSTDPFSMARRQAPRKTTHTSITFKTPEEKRTILLDAMDKWIKGVGDHLKEKGVSPYGYDVINEAITDGSHLRRGVDNVFGDDDSEPVENEDGLTLNWKNNNFYWGYYVKDYAVQAYQKARQYLPTETKLFYNDYNLETSEGKRKAAIQFVKDIDAANGSPIVDGIGTQMHLTLNVSEDDDLNTQIEKFMAQVDASLTDLVATGKLVRITELDISLGTASPASYQLEAQYEAYRRVFESYKRIVPENQQTGITIWGVSDHPDEHVYWLPDQSPNLWDKDYKRKWAYKGVCDGIAGEDLGQQYNGDDYKKYYDE